MDEQSPAPEHNQMAEILQRLQALEAENAELKAKQPKFQPMQRIERPRSGGYVPPEELRKRDMKELHSNGQMLARNLSVYDNPQRWADVPEQYRPVFQTGDLVAVNPEAQVHGSDKTWGEVSLPGGGTASQVVGEVVATLGRSRTWEPKYRVRIPGLTRSGGDGFHESELVPA